MRVNDISNVGQTPHDYIRGLLKHRNTYKVANNTELVVNDDDSVSVWLHSTEIIRAYRNGRTILRSGGWQTVTTKQRINAFLPSGMCVSQKRYEWFVYARASDVLVTSRTDWELIGEFEDGVTLVFNEFGKFREFRPYMSEYAMRQIHAIAIRYVFSTDGPTDVESVNAWMTGHPNYSHLASSVLVPHIADMASDMRTAGLRAA